MKSSAIKRKKSLAAQIISSLKYKGNMDVELIALILIMVLFGLIMVASASSVTALYRYGDSMKFFERQLIVAIGGFIGMLAISKIDYHILASRQVLRPILITVWLFVFITAFVGEDLNGARRWINIGGVTIQPSELAKIAWIIYFASVCSKQKPRELQSPGVWIKYLIMIAIIVVPLMLQPHKSAMLLVTLVCLVIGFAAGANWKPLTIVLPSGGALLLIIALCDEYSRRRLTGFLNPFNDLRGDGWQAAQSLYAIGSGGFFGSGLGKSIQKANIPEPHCDFIFPIICEELGFVGAMAVILLFFLLIIRCIKIAMEAPDKLGTLIVVGVSVLIFLQMLINILVVTAWFPVTGMPLPFFSAGGTSLLFTMCSMGIVLNVSRQGKRTVVQRNKQKTKK